VSIIPPHLGDGKDRRHFPAHDPLTCGIAAEWDCPACRAARDADWIERYPVLAKPAPGEHNAIAGSFEEQFARVFAPRPARPLSEKAVERVFASIQRHRQELRSVLLDLLAEDIGIIVARILNEKRKAYAPKT
jgi:hypothetical protein